MQRSANLFLFAICKIGTLQHTNQANVQVCAQGKPSKRHPLHEFRWWLSSRSPSKPWSTLYTSGIPAFSNAIPASTERCPDRQINTTGRFALAAFLTREIKCGLMSHSSPSTQGISIEPFGWPTNMCSISLRTSTNTASGSSARKSNACLGVMCSMVHSYIRVATSNVHVGSPAGQRKYSIVRASTIFHVVANKLYCPSEISCNFSGCMMWPSSSETLILATYTTIISGK